MAKRSSSSNQRGKLNVDVTPAMPVERGTREIRRGMWVKRGKQVGIAFDALLTIQGQQVTQREFHVVNENGDTTDIVPMDYRELQQADYDDIPAPRRKGFSEQRGALLGYHRRGK